MDNTIARYTYIATAEPLGSIDVLNKYGLDLQGSNITPDDIGNAINTAVSENGEPALVDIMSLHPDKGILVELFGSSNNGGSNNSAANSSTQNCSTTTPMTMSMTMENGKKNFLDNPTNAILAVGVAVLVLVLLKKN